MATPRPLLVNTTHLSPRRRRIQRWWWVQPCKRNAGKRGRQMSAHTASAPAHPAEPGDGGISSLWPALKLDSGASVHIVRDPSLLSDLRDAPEELLVTAAAHGGNKMTVNKIGDIRVLDRFTIPNVYLLPELRDDGLISVRQLARQGICTFFVGDRARLYAGTDLVGVAVAELDDPYGLYVLHSLFVPKIIASARRACGGRSWCAWRWRPSFAADDAGAAATAADEQQENMLSLTDSYRY